MKYSLRALAATFAAVGTVAIAGPAYAGSYNGVCESSNGGEVCLYRYNDIKNSPVYDTLYSKANYDGSTFFGTSTLIDKNTKAAVNKDPNNGVKLFSGRNYTGYIRTIPAGQSVGYSYSVSSHCFTSNAACPK